MQVLDSDPVAARLERIEQRLDALERLFAYDVRRESAPPIPAPVALRSGEPAVTAIDAVPVLTLIGRTFVILAGAYLLRALTESRAISAGVGVALGLAYACVWSAVADRAALRGSLSAIFYGACTAILGLPLLWEAVTRFSLIGPGAAAALLAGLTAAGLALAWHRHLEPLAWLATLGALATGCGLLFVTQAIVPFAALFVALGIATLWLGYDRGWPGPRWPAAFVADAAVLGLAARALTTPPRDAPEAVLAVQVALLASYLGSIAIRTLVRGRDVIPFEVAQTAAMLAARLGGAMVVAEASGIARGALGAALLAMAVILYAVAFAFIDRQTGRRVNFYFYTSLALVFVLSGSDLVLKGALLGLTWAGLAIVAGAAARRYGRIALAIHAEVYVGAAAAATGLLAASVDALFGPAASVSPAIGSAAWAVLVALGVVVVLTVEAPIDEPSTALRIPGWGLAALAAVCVGGVCAFGAIKAVDALSLPGRAGLVATARTGALAGAVVAVAWLGRRAVTRAFGYLLYPLLAWGAVKLVMEDFAVSPPGLLFVALALYGSALILGPRLRSSAASARQAP